METAKGSDVFEVYAGKVQFDQQQLTIPVHVGNGLSEFLLGRQWSTATVGPKARIARQQMSGQPSQANVHQDSSRRYSTILHPRRSWVVSTGSQPNPIYGRSGRR